MTMREEITLRDSSLKTTPAPILVFSRRKVYFHGEHVSQMAGLVTRIAWSIASYYKNIEHCFLGFRDQSTCGTTRAAKQQTDLYAG